MWALEKAGFDSDDLLYAAFDLSDGGKALVAHEGSPRARRTKVMKHAQAATYQVRNKSSGDLICGCCQEKHDCCKCESTIRSPPRVRG